MRRPSRPRPPAPSSLLAAACTAAAVLCGVRYMAAATNTPAGVETTPSGALHSSPLPSDHGGVLYERRRGSGGAALYHSFRLESSASPLTIGAAARLLADPDDSRLRTTMTELLQSSEFSAYFFEMPPVTGAQMDSLSFEFILNDAPSLAGITEGEPESFAEYVGS